jgi:hypothetical protein
MERKPLVGNGLEKKNSYKGGTQREIARTAGVS